MKQIGIANLVANARLLAEATRATVRRMGLELLAPDSQGAGVAAAQEIYERVAVKKMVPA